MHGRLVAPVWHNREVHRDFENWSFRKRTIYDPGKYVDAGGHGALVLPGSFQLHPTRNYTYRFAATGCPAFVNSEDSPCHVGFVDFDAEHRSILIGKHPPGQVVRQDADSSISEKFNLDGASSLKVQDFRPDSVTIAIASTTSITTFRGADIVAEHEKIEDIDSFDASPFIHSELVTCTRNSLKLGNSSISLKSNLIVEDVTFFTHPRHIAAVQKDSVVHCDVRAPADVSKIVDSTCLNLLPKNCFSFAKVNCNNVNQLLVVSDDCISLWDVRYTTQPMGVFNHYVPRSAQLLGMQTLRLEDSLLLLVRSSVKSTLFEFDSAFSSPNAVLLGPQLQFASPADIGQYYWDQTGNRVPEDVWKRLSEPIAGSCIVPIAEDGNELFLHSVTITGDQFRQRIVRKSQQEAEDSLRGEKTYAFGMDAFALNSDQLKEVKDQIEELVKISRMPTKNLPDPNSSLVIGSGTVLLEGTSLPQCGCGLCPGAVHSTNPENKCSTCDLGGAADLLNEAWLEGGLFRKTEGLTEEEETRYRELLGPNASGLAVSDAVRAAWGEVDWRVVEETEAGAAVGDVDDPAEADGNADVYEDED